MKRRIKFGLNKIMANKIKISMLFLFMIVCLNFSEVYGDVSKSNVRMNNLPIINTEDEPEDKGKEDDDSKNDSGIMKKIKEKKVVVIVSVSVILAAVLLVLIIVILIKKRKKRVYIKKPVLKMEEEKNSLLKVVLYDLNHSDVQYIGVAENAIRIGRSGDNDIIISYDGTISSRHCLIIKRGKLYYLIDNNSSNGTYYDGERVINETPIISGKTIKIGRQLFRVEILNR